jgi:GH25 family lysozyme M1 (1,4-beta-N-acetylmuramidase)
MSRSTCRIGRATTINWAQVKATGIRCVMIKATQGLSKDKRWDANRAGARQQGLLVIPYAFVTDDDPVEQAQFFVQTTGLVAGMPAALDWEGNNAPAAEVVERIGIEVAKVIDRDPLGYWGLHPPGAPTATMARWPRWIPRYPLNDDGNFDMAHQPTAPWLFWQYTQKMQIDGIHGDVDASLFSGSEAELTAWCETGVLPASLAPVPASV